MRGRLLLPLWLAAGAAIGGTPPPSLFFTAAINADLDDPLLENALYVTYVRSMVAHGTITGIDLDDARQAPGVVAAYSAADLADMPLLVACQLLEPHPLLLGVLQLPVGGLEEAARFARHHLDVVRAEAQRGPAAVHRGVAAAQHDDPLANAVAVPKSNTGQPVDTDVNVRIRGRASGQL